MHIYRHRLENTFSTIDTIGIDAIPERRCLRSCAGVCAPYLIECLVELPYKVQDIVCVLEVIEVDGKLVCVVFPVDTDSTFDGGWVVFGEDDPVASCYFKTLKAFELIQDDL